jgi:circadian clock protein KaiC
MRGSEAVMIRLSNTGIPGFDQILGGGLPTESNILLEGDPGTGKTTMGMQFLYHGAVTYGEPGIYVTFEEMPHQIYRDMYRYGWDLRALEANNMLRVLGCSPDVFLALIQGQDEFFTHMMNGVEYKRIVIDSVSIFKHHVEDKQNYRKVLYSLLSALKRLSLTSLLIYEGSTARAADPVLEHFVSDGIIRLASRTHQDTFKTRTLEVLKMRASHFDAREFVFRMSEKGIYVSSPTGVYLESPDIQLKQTSRHLAEVLTQTLKTGTITLLDAGSLVDVLALQRAVILHRLREKDSHILLSLSASTTIPDFLELSPQIRAVFDERRMHFLEQFRRQTPEEFKPFIFDMSELNDREYRQLISNRLASMVSESTQGGARWLLGYDITDIYNRRGPDFVIRLLPEVISYEKSIGVTVLVIANLREMNAGVRAMLERTSDGVMRTWIEQGYQYFQVVKSSTGSVCAPFVVETQYQTKDIRLV